MAVRVAWWPGAGDGSLATGRQLVRGRVGRGFPSPNLPPAPPPRPAPRGLGDMRENYKSLELLPSKRIRNARPVWLSWYCDRCRVNVS